MLETVSAFGTVGPSTGATAALSNLGRWLTAPLTFLGRVGPLTFAAAPAIAAEQQDVACPYAYEDVVVGCPLPRRRDAAARRSPACAKATTRALGTDMQRFGIIGLGSFGSAAAEALHAARHDVLAGTDADLTHAAKLD